MKIFKTHIEMGETEVEVRVEYSIEGPDHAVGLYGYHIDELLVFLGDTENEIADQLTKAQLIQVTDMANERDRD